MSAMAILMRDESARLMADKILYSGASEASHGNTYEEAHHSMGWRVSKNIKERRIATSHDARTYGNKRAKADDLCGPEGSSIS